MNVSKSVSSVVMVGDTMTLYADKRAIVKLQDTPVAVIVYCLGIQFKRSNTILFFTFSSATSHQILMELVFLFSNFEFYFWTCAKVIVL